MFNTFNMGVGMTVTVSASDADEALSILRGCGEDAYIAGELAQTGKVSENGAKVVIC